MSRRDTIRRRRDSPHRPPDPCRHGCQMFRPLSCEVLDPYTVKMAAACVACGRVETKVGTVDCGDAEGFAHAFMASRTIGGLRA